MKTHIISLFFLVICSFSVNAQTIPIEQYYQNDNSDKNNAYFKDVNGLLNKYLGVWEYNQNGHYLKIQFFKLTYNPEHPYNSIFNIQQYADRIYARFEYKLNGTTIYNTFNQTDNPSKWFIYSVAGSIISTNKIRLYYKEPSEGCRPKNDNLVLTFQEGNPAQLVWERTPQKYATGSFRCDGEVVDNTPFQIPANMVLTKVTTNEGGLIPFPRD